MDIVLPFVQTHARSRGRGCSYKSQRRQRDLVYATKYPSQDGPKTGLRLLELTTGNAKWLVPETEPSLQGSQIHWTFGLLPNAAFTPDSKAVIASYHGKLWRIFCRSCDRPGCYEEFQPSRRSPLQRFCSHSCRRALERVLERERRWRERQPEQEWRSRQGGTIC